MQQTGQASRDRVTLRRLCRAAPCTRFQHLCHTPRNGIAGSRCLLYCLPHQPREELRGLSWQQYLRYPTDEQGVVAECVRGLPELRDMAELHVRARPLANRSVTTLRLEHVSTHFTQSMTRAFDNLLPPLGLPALSKSGAGGPTSASKFPKEEGPVGHAAFSERLAQAASKFDLSRHPPPPDKVDHVSDKDAKIRLREVLLNEKHLRPLLRGLRLSLGYEAMQTWQLPPDIERLSAAVDQAVGSFCRKGWAGRVGEWAEC